MLHIMGAALERYRDRRRQRRAALAVLPSAREMADRVLAGKLSIHDIEDRSDIVNIQDHVAQEGQGAIPERDTERLGRSDAAIILMRKIWLRELRIVRRPALEELVSAGRSGRHQRSALTGNSMKINIAAQQFFRISD